MLTVVERVARSHARSSQGQGGSLLNTADAQVTTAPGTVLQAAMEAMKQFEAHGLSVVQSLEQELEQLGRAHQ
jgi:hypothetical protein